MIYNDRTGKYTTYKFQRTKESTRATCTILDSVNMPTNNLIIGKHLQIPIIHFNILIRLHIQRHVCTSLTVSVSNSGQPVKCASKYHTKKPWNKIHCWIPAQSTHNYILLHTPTIIHTKKRFALAYHLHKKIPSTTKLSHSALLHTRTLLHYALCKMIYKYVRWYWWYFWCNCDILDYIS